MSGDSGCPRALIPEHDDAGAVPGRDHALERSVLNRMILDVHGQPLRLRIERGSLGDGPRQQHSVVLEAEVVVQVAGQVLLHAEEQALVRPGAFRALGGELHVARRFRRRAEVALLFVFFENHFFSGGLRPRPLTRCARGGPTPRSARVARSRRSLAVSISPRDFALRDPDAHTALGAVARSAKAARVARSLRSLAWASRQLTSPMRRLIGRDSARRISPATMPKSATLVNSAGSGIDS